MGTVAHCLDIHATRHRIAVGQQKMPPDVVTTNVASLTALLAVIQIVTVALVTA